jgi:hypothetical protein
MWFFGSKIKPQKTELGDALNASRTRTVRYSLTQLRYGLGKIKAHQLLERDAPTLSLSPH